MHSLHSLVRYVHMHLMYFTDFEADYMGDCSRNPSPWRPPTPSPPPEPTLFLPQLTGAPLIHLCLPFVVSMGMLLTIRDLSSPHVDPRGEIQPQKSYLDPSPCASGVPTETPLSVQISAIQGENTKIELDCCWASLEQKSHRFNWLNFESWDAMRTRKARKLARPDSHLRKPIMTVLYDLRESSGDVSMSKLSSGKTKTLGKACCACCQSIEHNIHQCSEVAKLSKGQL